MVTQKPHSVGCRVCGNTDEKARGLCEAHFQRFRAKMRAFATETEREQFEFELIRLGWLAEKSKPGRKKTGDIFDVVAENVAETAAELRKPLRRSTSRKKKS